jgi:aspartate/tyrosine/aromatic aminotransferase
MNKEEYITRALSEIIKDLLISTAKSKEFVESWQGKKVGSKFELRPRKERKEIEKYIEQKSKKIAKNVISRIKKEGALSDKYILSNKERIMKIIKEEMRRFKK